MILYCGVPFANEAVAAQPTGGDCGYCASADSSPCVRTYAYVLPSGDNPTGPQLNYPQSGGLGFAVGCTLFADIVDIP
ncbi:MAG: hypothetical protein WD716_00035 [Fimbriimonadaceae bacterium]